MMNNPNLNEKKYDLLPYDVIASAVSGNVEAIRKVVKHYERYITSLASKLSINGDGSTSTEIDDELKLTLETQLITKILSFSI